MTAPSEDMRVACADGAAVAMTTPVTTISDGAAMELSSIERASSALARNACARASALPGHPRTVARNACARACARASALSALLGPQMTVIIQHQSGKTSNNKAGINKWQCMSR